MTLHQPSQTTDWVYLMFLQLQLPMAPELLATQPKQYESYTCAIRYNNDSLKKVDNTNLWFQGYKGTSRLDYALGLPTQLLKNEQV